MCLNVVFAYKIVDFILGMPIEKKIRKDCTASTRSTLPGNSDLMQRKSGYPKQFEREGGDFLRVKVIQPAEDVPRVGGKGVSEKALE